MKPIDAEWGKRLGHRGKKPCPVLVLTGETRIVSLGFLPIGRQHNSAEAGVVTMGGV
jgi:hypothetical protein